jgi:hypothetical protein
MYLLGQIQYGRYPDVTNVHPSTEEKYGRGQNVKDKISEDLMGHVHHDAVAVPQDKAPFESPQSVGIFQEALTGVLDSEVVPAGYGLREEEWGNGIYPTSELIKVARKEVEISLPFEIWYPRAVKWAQGLQVMAIVQEYHDMSY